MLIAKLLLLLLMKVFVYLIAVLIRSILLYTQPDFSPQVFVLNSLLWLVMAVCIPPLEGQLHARPASAGICAYKTKMTQQR